MTRRGSETLVSYSNPSSSTFPFDVPRIESQRCEKCESPAPLEGGWKPDGLDFFYSASSSNGLRLTMFLGPRREGM